MSEESSGAPGFRAARGELPVDPRHPVADRDLLRALLLALVAVGAGGGALAGLRALVVLAGLREGQRKILAKLDELGLTEGERDSIVRGNAVRIFRLDEKDRPETWEEKLLYYADKRVMHDKIMPLKQRLAEGHKRNVHLHGSAAQSKTNTSKVDPLIYEMEKEIFEKIGLDPLEVTDEFIDSY